MDDYKVMYVHRATREGEGVRFDVETVDGLDSFTLHNDNTPRGIKLDLALELGPGCVMMFTPQGISVAHHAGDKCAGCGYGTGESIHHVLSVKQRHADEIRAAVNNEPPPEDLLDTLFTIMANRAMRGRPVM